MRVLWFAVNPSLYDENDRPHNGGGWIASLEALVRTIPDVKLGVAFEHADLCFRIERDAVTYYPINVGQSRWQRFKSKFIFSAEEKRIIPACIKIINDFKPDIIHVFGSEWCFGLVAERTSVPVVVHMQGSIPPYYNARFPPGYNKMDCILYNGFNLKRTVGQLLIDRAFKLRAKREERILRICSYYMGRTKWDKNLTRFYAPKSKYFYCSEALREPFLNTKKIWAPHNRGHVVLITTTSSALYKGLDVILKTAKLLKENTSINFEWRVLGVKEAFFHEWKTKIKASQVNVKLVGIVSAECLRDELLNSDIFVHASYIDNSPNSVCEAQLLGLPVISTHVGGVSSLVKHRETGLLVPANDPYTMATYIVSMHNERGLAVSLGKRARETALERHDPKQIITDLLAVYRGVINDGKK